MATTTIQISEELRDSIKQFGKKGESYEDILRRWEKLATRQMFHDFLYDDSNCVTIDEAREMILNDD